ncbi:MAG: PASTA domain-containing protein [Treponemataceae bacterium]
MKLFNKFDIDFQFDLDAVESYIAARLRLFIAAALALLAFTVLIALTVFFITLRGAEQTMVPNVKGKDLTAALLELQSKELYPRIQLRYSQSAADKGAILEQEPAPGSIVKAGRRVKLVVSRGVVVDKVENYLGQNIDDVKMHLQTLFSTSARPLLALREPTIYRFSTENAGTILEQKPVPGTEISGPTKLEIVVSRGPENAMVKVPDLVGLPIADAMDRIKESGVFFTFAVRQAQAKEAAGTIVSQLPAGQTVVSSNTRVAVVVSSPTKLGDGEVFGLFERQLPDYPYPLAVRLEALLPTGERRRVVTVDHPGGAFSAPYILPDGAVLILTVLNRELYREEIHGGK